jgi:hypothetical protein
VGTRPVLGDLLRRLTRLASFLRVVAWRAESEQHRRPHREPRLRLQLHRNPRPRLQLHRNPRPRQHRYSIRDTRNIRPRQHRTATATATAPAPLLDLARLQTARTATATAQHRTATATAQHRDRDSTAPRPRQHSTAPQPRPHSTAPRPHLDLPTLGGGSPHRPPPPPSRAFLARAGSSLKAHATAVTRPHADSPESDGTRSAERPTPSRTRAKRVVCSQVGRSAVGEAWGRRATRIPTTTGDSRRSRRLRPRRPRVVHRHAKVS